MNTIACRIEECDAPSISRGLCRSCYQKIRRLGRLEDYPATISTARHSLGDVDVEARTATCSVCGPVSIRVKKSRKAHECVTVSRRSPASTARRRRERLKQYYGLTKEDYDGLLRSQGNACAICRTTESGARDWHVDHDHACCPGRKTCGQCVRGILCHRCNAGLGYFRDNTTNMARAIEYLTR